jgi:hypothetical protein
MAERNPYSMGELLALDAYDMAPLRGLPDATKASPAPFDAPGAPSPYDLPVPHLGASGTNVRTPYLSGSLDVPLAGGTLGVRGGRTVGSPGYNAGLSYRRGF